MSKTDLAFESGSILASVNHPLLAAVLAGGRVALGEIRKFYPNANDALTAFINDEVQQAVFSRLPEIERNLREIREQIEDEPSATQIALVYKTFVDGFAQADGKKRTLLLNALVNAFDPELYEQGMTARLLALMDKLDYPDLSFLMKHGAVPEGNPVQAWRDPTSIDGYHADRLVGAGLMTKRSINPGHPDVSNDVAHVSGLGRWMIRLIRDPKTRDSDE